MNKLKELQPTQFILLGFLTVILVGSILLSLPIATADGSVTPYIDALFTATTSVCVTGLVTVSTAYHWSVFGQFVILLLVQLGGLGVVTIMISFMLAFHRRIGMKNRILIQQSYGLNSMQGIVSLLIKIVKGTIVVEMVGFVCYLPVLVPQNGPKGIWQSLFLSVSAFCNAGMDLMGDTSLADYAGNYWMNIVTMTLIILGGIGFIVWWEIIHFIRLRRKEKISFRKIRQKTSLHTKIVLSFTVVLIVLGAIVVFVFEYNNPETLGSMSLPQKIMASLFQSVTTRTAGFYTISQTGMQDSSSLFCILLMFIGGSPAGTAGGVKTATLAILFFSVVSEWKGRSEIRAFGRAIPKENVRKGLAIIITSLSIWFIMTMLLCAVEKYNFMRLAYETMSAIGTVGLSKDLTGLLNNYGKLIIIFLMYAGRIGPITLATALAESGKNKENDMVHYPDENLLLG